jgi:hypothetical protein
VIAKFSDGSNVFISAQKMQGWEWEICDFPKALKIMSDKIVKMVNIIKSNSVQGFSVNSVMIRRAVI